jgi:hypothetical protein
VPQRLQDFRLVANILGAEATATMRQGVLECSSHWRSVAQELVDQQVTFEHDGRRVDATLDGPPIDVFVTLVRCPVEVVAAAFEMSQRARDEVGVT